LQPAAEIVEPEVKNTYDRGFKTTTSSNPNFESGAAVMELIDDFEEVKLEDEIIPKVKPSDVQQELI
jgi:hypothetical protein